ncbi:hypothetical protein BDY19DRAFT_394591 [Irpex rosettiformis]|uniref:Uncharacterized protein n=1 Tax=Irpex rosettiformis TaxID=378272 RepID=A0ACB8TV59_9APHY|nr:hypothetical protein BDY19DRAFT_394591 [Irpex rosettiformis]
MDKLTLNVSKPAEEWIKAIRGEDRKCVDNWEKHLQTKVLLRADWANVLQHLDSFRAVLREEQARGLEEVGMLVPEDHLKQCATFLRTGTSCYDLGTLDTRTRPTALTPRARDLASLLCVDIFGTIPIFSDENGEKLRFIDDIECAVARLLPALSYNSQGCREGPISRIISSSLNTQFPGDDFLSN